MKRIARLAVLVVLVVAGGGCGQAPADIPWAAPAMEHGAGIEQDVQALLDTYADALAGKDKDAFLSTLDPAAAEFRSSQEESFRRLEDVPFDRYDIKLDSITSTDGDTVAKVSASYTLKGSFPDLPDPQRGAFRLVNTDSGWKLAGDATRAALGKEHDVHLEDFGKVAVHESSHAIVFYLDGNSDVAARAGDFVDAAWPQLTSVLPDAGAPRVPVWIFNDHGQVDAAFPGQWQEWVGGASRKLGTQENSGGEIILDAQLFERSDVETPDYNRKMLAHELTHIFLFPYTSLKTPPFLVEGLADYVAGLESTPMLAGKLENGEAISPTLTDLYQPAGFDVLLTDEAAQLAYEESDTAVAYLVREYGDQKLLELLQEFKRREDEGISQDQLVDESFSSVLGVGWDGFERGWRAFVLGGGVG